MADVHCLRRKRGGEGKGAVFSTTHIADLGSTCTLGKLLRLWMRRFTMIISAWWLRASSEFTKLATKR